MNETFHRHRVALDAARRVLDEATESLSAARRTTLSLASRLARASGRELDALAAALAQARIAESSAREELTNASKANANATHRFGTSADPRTAIDAWNAETPLLLLPVRLETRFMRIEPPSGAASAARDELWVRIYPDDCAVDNFEPELSETEVTSGRRYWAERWAAGSDDALARAAWRNLVAGHGAGRAAWIVDQKQPQTTAPERPADGILLVIASENPPSPGAERDRISDYWTRAWRAGDDATALTAARDDLAGALQRDVAEVIASTRPSNFNAAPPSTVTRATAAVVVAWLTVDQTAGKTRSATQPSRVEVLPERFVVLGYQKGTLVFEAETTPVVSPLVVSADFSSEEQFSHTGQGDLTVPPELAWMTDFASAIGAGIGVKIVLDPARVDLSAPIDRVIAIGLRLSEDADGGQQRMSALIAHHRFSRPGFALLPQGAPTNNTDAESAAFARGEDPSATYDATFHAPFAPSDWWSRRDGEWLADALGLPRAVFQSVDGAHRLDFAEARAMNRALWPSTLGYTLETMLAPAISADQAEAARWFYTRFVSGRGFLPCIRIGDQPYGVLAVSALSQWTWLGESEPWVGTETPDGSGTFLRGLARVLAEMRTDWRRLAQGAAQLTAGGGGHQALLDVLGLHPASVEFHARFAESLEHLYNLARLSGSGTRLDDFAADLSEPALLLLRKLGYQDQDTPDGLNRFFAEHATRLNGPVIDDRPLSERDPVRVYSLDGQNYLAWLADRARHAFEDLRQERGFIDNTPPHALLYVLARHALLLGYWGAALERQLAAGTLAPEAAAQVRREPSTVHVAEGTASESRYAALYDRARAASGRAATVAEAIGESLATSEARGPLAEQLAALDVLKQLPTARLERCFAEHLDTASYRLDAWLLGLVHYQLAALRYRSGGGEPRGGLYLGAVGWLENLQRKAAFPAAPLGPDLTAVFGNAPVVRDPQSGGHLLAPSLTHAKTAAVLRAGSIGAGGGNDALAVNLSSARIRSALALIEGIRTGQPLGALLGYRLQRGLRDRNLDHIVSPLRARFPLVANQIRSTKIEGMPIEQLEADNVIDGRKLVEALRDTDLEAFARGLDAVPPVTAAQATAIAGEIDKLFDGLDALADLALSEGVHQAVHGNYDRVASVLDAYGKGTFPPEPDIVRTPRSGTSLTHRVGLHLETGLAHDTVSWPGTPTPRSMAQPMVNKWLASIFPPPEKICCRVGWGAAGEEVVSASQLGIQPIDLLYVGALDGETTLRELDDRIFQRVIDARHPPADVELTIDHLHRFPSDRVSFFELGALIRHLRKLLITSRPLAATDLAPAESAAAAKLALAVIDPARVRTARGRLTVLTQQLSAFLAAPPAIVDDTIARAAILFAEASAFGFQQGWGFLYVQRRQCFAAALAALNDVINRWTERRSEFDARWVEYVARVASLSDGERRAALVRLDILVAATPTTPPPASFAAYETGLTGRTTAFDGKLAQLVALRDNLPAGLDALLTSMETLVTQAPPLSRFDTEPLDPGPHRLAAGRLSDALLSRITPLIDDIDKRAKAVDAALGADPDVEQLQRAGSALLGDDVKLIPEISFAAAQRADLSSAYAGSGGLLDYLKGATGDFPIEDWLSGIARVREPMFAFEQTMLYAQALAPAAPELTLTPIQLPVRQGESWLALAFDPAAPPTGERLLYTAHYATGTNSVSACGLLIDEWTEVIPAKDETAGLAFHYDRPSSEPPQAWLLVTAPRLTGAWKWSDVLNALDETFDLMRIRAVEPQHLEELPYARFLPATTSAAALNDISITLNLGRVNQFHSRVRIDPNG